jgi:hypothetical protein
LLTPELQIYETKTLILEFTSGRKVSHSFDGVAQDKFELYDIGCLLLVQVTFFHRFGAMAETAMKYGSK